MYFLAALYWRGSRQSRADQNRMLMGAGGSSKDMSKRRSPQEKASIAVEFFLIPAYLQPNCAADTMCRRPHFRIGKIFVGRQAGTCQQGRYGKKPNPGNRESQKNHRRNNHSEITIVNDKKTLKQKDEGKGSICTWNRQA